MGALTTLTKSLGRHCMKNSRTYISRSTQPLLNFLISENSKFTSNVSNSHFHRFQSRRTFILEPARSELVKLQRFSDSDSGKTACRIWYVCLLVFVINLLVEVEFIACFTGIIEVSLNKPGAKNAIGTDMLRALKQTLESISDDSSANVVMINSSVPKVFCAGADLKVLRSSVYICTILSKFLGFERDIAWSWISSVNYLYN